MDGRIETFWGPGTFCWRGSVGYSPFMIWQFAESETKAVELILSKWVKTTEKDGFRLLPNDPDCLGVFFNGCFVDVPQLEEIRKVLENPPVEFVCGNHGSGYVSCLDG